MPDTSNSNPFTGIQSVPYHTHNGTDSPLVTNIPVTTYGGFVLSGVAGVPFPIGWTASTSGTGLYTITHNLNSALYSVTASLLGNAGFAAINNHGHNSFSVNTFNSSGTATNENFYFSVVFNLYK